MNVCWKFARKLTWKLSAFLISFCARSVEIVKHQKVNSHHHLIYSFAFPRWSRLNANELNAPWNACENRNCNLWLYADVNCKFAFLSRIRWKVAEAPNSLNVHCTKLNALLNKIECAIYNDLCVQLAAPETEVERLIKAPLALRRKLSTSNYYLNKYGS